MAVTTDLEKIVEDAAAYLYVWALKDIPQDLRDALKAARERETSISGQRVLDTILRNVEVADAEKNLVCQDTGIAVYYCRVGEHFPLHPARIYQALYDGTERATIEHPLRSNTVHTLSRARTRGRTSATACRSSTGTSSRAGTASTSSAFRRAPDPRT
jgi:tartrate dehydratase alpha subunit/fumarate hydratase class I-like protein